MFETAWFALIAAAFVLSLCSCFAVRQVATRLRLVDLPNERSLHKTPVPRLGGVGIILAVGAGTAFASLSPGLLDHTDSLVWIVGSGAIAVLGFVDDIHPLPVLFRFLAQILLAAAVATLLIRGDSLHIAAGLDVGLGRWPLRLLGTMFLVGLTNIYNFMDGMDGLAAVQGMGAALAAAWGCALYGQDDLSFLALLIAAAVGGFFMHNAPPATIFLGDAGSTFLGFGFGAKALAAAGRPSPLPFAVIPTALAPFLLDATFTLIRRLLRRERIWVAHKTHL